MKTRKKKNKLEQLAWLIAGISLGVSVSTAYQYLKRDPLYISSDKTTLTAKFTPIQWHQFVEYTRIRRKFQNLLIKKFLSGDKLNLNPKLDRFRTNLPHEPHPQLYVGNVSCFADTDGAVECLLKPAGRYCDYSDQEECDTTHPDIYYPKK